MWVTTCLCLVMALTPVLAHDYDLEDLTDTNLETIQFETASLCPLVKPMTEFNIFTVLGSWYVVQYYSSSEEALTYHCMRVNFRLSRGNMDMIMHLSYRYVDDPNDETQSGNITWQIPNPTTPEHWRHIEDQYKGVYNTDVVDTDYENWLLLLHCSDTESSKKFLSTFILSRTPKLDNMTISYLREKVSQFQVDLEYLFPVNQTQCVDNPENLKIITKPTEHPIFHPPESRRKSRRSRG